MMMIKERIKRNKALLIIIIVIEVKREGEILSVWEQSPLLIIILLLFNLKLQQTISLIPKMLQIFIFNIIIIILDFLSQLLLILIFHNLSLL